MDGASGVETTERFELRAGPYAGRDLDVVSLRGREAISQLYRFDVEVASALDAATLEASILEQDATLVLPGGGGTPRRVHGVLVALSSRGEDADHRRRYRVRIAPRAWLLGLRKTSRIFQDVTVADVVAQVLGALDVPLRWAVGRTLRAREYCVQYQETDWELVARLVAEEGIFFYFEEANGKERLVFADSAERYGAALEAPLVARDVGFTGPYDVTAFALRRAVRPKSTIVRDYDFARPLLDVSGGAAAPASLRPNAIDAERLEHYEHDGDFLEPDADSVRARVQLEQLAADARRAKGESRAPALAAGHTFRLDEHAVPETNGEYVVTSVAHEARAPEKDAIGLAEPLYTNRFACAPAKIVVRPPRPPRVVRQVTETATVVGPPGEEIHVDRMGRIRVHFHWDREAPKETSSCWIRVAQAWAGASWGFQFIPRIGMEVLVTFVGGDPDRPIVTACVYNGTHPSPFPLPESKTKSGIRTSSTPGGQGANELSFEDAKGREQVYVHAERDLDEVVKHRRTTLVGERDETTVVDAQVTTVGKARVTTVGLADTLTVGGQHALLVGGGSSTRVRADKSEVVGGDASSEVRGTLTQTVAGEHVMTVAKDQTVRVTENASMVIGDGGESATGEVYVWGDYKVGARRTIEIRADVCLRLACGDTVIELGPKELKLLGKKLSLEAKEELAASGKGPAISLKDTAEIMAKVVRITSEKASIEMDKVARVDGQQVLLNCKGVSKQPDPETGEPPPTKTLKLKLSNPDLEPYKGKEYVLSVGGARLEGTTDGDGNLTADVPKDATTGNVVLWTEKRPEGPKVEWTIAIDEMPDVGTLPGALKRLRSLGYSVNPEAKKPDARTKKAIKSFQLDHELPGSGELDAQTQAKLVDVFGH